MKLIAAALLAIAACYAFYGGAMAAWSYFEMSDIVEQALEDHGRSGAVPVRAAILKGATDAGVRLEERQVTVADEENAIRVRVRWTWPVVQFKGEEVLALPLWLERSSTRL